MTVRDLIKTLRDPAIDPDAETGVEHVSVSNDLRRRINLHSAPFRNGKIKLKDWDGIRFATRQTNVSKTG
jgi:hypothetical protein